MNALFFQIAVIGIAAMAAQWLAWRLRIPAIVFLLLFGFALGPLAHVIDPRALMGPMFRPAIEAAIAIILFEGGLQLRLKDIAEARKAVGSIVILGAPVGWGLITLAAHYIAGLEFPVAAVLGGMLVVTGPTVIMPMLRHALLQHRVASVLKWEGIFNDPVGILIAFLAFEYFTVAGAGMGFFIERLGLIALIAAAAIAAGFITARVFREGWVPEYLKSPMLLVAVIVMFYASNLALHESGLIAVMAYGMTLANLPVESIQEIRRFKETTTLLLVSGVFLLLTADLNARVMLSMNWRGVPFILALLFIVRPLTALIAGVFSNLNLRELVLIGWVAPRGVVCAAMAGVLGPLMVEVGYADGAQILPLCFSIVVISVLAQGLSVRQLARRLCLTLESHNGLIIAGAWGWAVQLAEVLRARGIDVLIADGDWRRLQAARLSDIPVYYGELLSENAEAAVEHHAYDALLAATPNPAYNALLCGQFADVMGRARLYTLHPDEEGVALRHRLARMLKGREWAPDRLTLDRLESLYAEGWRFRTSRIGKAPDGDEIKVPVESETLMVVGVIGRNGNLRLFSRGERAAPRTEGAYALFMEKQDHPA
ncbi:MAG: sodium:proton antiporter [Rhodospirillales bacterium]|nr:sodium:proton antiporter [Alphaproteobacteria bacterium]MCB9986637.1 sodium:proton antiporter [Rhodospirillales bacterium]USO06834.1 MAG: sodium:proton antiporter [Rhodospirillales bacterium]